MKDWLLEKVCMQKQSWSSGVTTRVSGTTAGAAWSSAGVAGTTTGPAGKTAAANGGEISRATATASEDSPAAAN